MRTTMVSRMARFSLFSACLGAFIGCGERPVSVSDTRFRNSSQIIDGQAAGVDDYRTTVALLGVERFRGEEYGNVVCTGTLVRRDVVLTAGHCIIDPTDPDSAGEDMEMYISLTNDLSGFGRSSVQLPDDAKRVTKMVRHPNFVTDDEMGWTMGLANGRDIGLLFLESEVTSVSPTPMIRAEEASRIQVGVPIHIAGYGQRSSDAWSEDAGIKFYGPSYLHEVGDYELQVGKRKSENANPPQDGLADECYGESGGPTFLEIDGQMKVIGVTSRGYDDNSDCITAGIDTRVDPFLDWIEEEMVRACNDGTRPDSACNENGESGGSGNQGNEGNDSNTSPNGGENPAGSEDNSQGTDLNGGTSGSSPANERVVGVDQGGCNAGGMPSLSALLLGVFMLRRRKTFRT